MALPGPWARVRGSLLRAISVAVLLREAARTSRRWQTYAARTAFSGVLLTVLLLGIWAAVSATRTAMVDTADLAWLGRGLFVGFSVVQMLMAMGLAPLMTASAIAEETDERTMEMLVLTRLSPGQILLGKIVSRVLVLLTIVAGALPVMALVVNLGGVSAVEVVAVTVHTLTTVALLSLLGAFFALFSKSPTLAAAAAACYAVPFFLMLPAVYVLCTGDPWSSAHFSTFASPTARSWSALVTPLSYLPSAAVVLSVTTPLFQHKVSNASFEHVFSDRVWNTSSWLKAVGAWLGVGLLTLPWMAPISWWLHNGGGSADVVVRSLGGLVSVFLWAFWSLGAALGTWAFLRVGMDVVDGIDAVFSGTQGLSVERERRSGTVGDNPVWWREARPRAWASNTAPIFVLWALFLLGVFQTGWWLVPGGLLSVGALNAAGAIVLATWLAARSVAEERRRGTFEVLLCTTLPSRSIVLGKFMAAALPTLPIVLLSAPLITFGVPQLLTLSGLGDRTAGEYVLRGFASFLWVVPIWLLAIAGALSLAVRSRRPGSAFGVVSVGLLAVFGLPAVMARIFPEVPLVVVPAQVLAPPLAGSFGWLQLLASGGAVLLVAASLISLLTARLRAWVGVGAVLLAFALGPREAHAEAPSADDIAAMEKVFKLRLRVRPLADGWSREGQWTTLAATIENAGPAASGTLELVELEQDGTTQRTYQRRVELPAGTRKEVTLLVRPGLGFGDRVVNLSTAEGRRAVAVLRLQPVSADDVVVAVLGKDALGLTAAVTTTTAEPVPGRKFRGTASSERQVRTGLVSPEATPRHSRGWSTVDWVVWPAADPTLVDEAQARALAGWVADGGHLLVSVSDTWRQVAGSPLGEVLPVELSGVRTADVTPLVTELGAAGGGETAVATAGARPGAFVRASAADGAPLWISWAYGAGSVHVVTADLRATSFDGVRDEGPLRRLLTLPRSGGFATDLLAAEPEVAERLARAFHLEPSQSPPILAYSEVTGADASWEQRVRGLLADIPGVAPLPLEWLVLFAASYLALIGPIDWFVLRALGRQPLTWVTFPVWIVLFAGGSLVLTSLSKGSQAVVVHVELADLFADAHRLRGTTFLGVFSTRKTTLSVESALPDSVMSPMTVAGYQNATRMVTGDGPGRVQYLAETWTLAYLRDEWTAPLEGGLPVEELSGGAFRIRNQLPFDLVDAVLLVPDPGTGLVLGAHPLGPLDEGGEVDVPASPNLDPLPASDPTLDGPRSALEMAGLFAWSLPSDRGALESEHRPVVLAIVDRPFDALTIEGLDPIENRVVVLRVPIDRASIAVDVSARVAELSFAEDPGPLTLNMSCGDGAHQAFTEVREGRAVVRTDVLSGTCDLSFNDEAQNYGWVSVRPGVRFACRKTDAAYECTEGTP